MVNKNIIISIIVDIVYEMLTFTINKCLWHMHSKVCYRKICLCHCFMVIAQTHVQAVATAH